MSALAVSPALAPGKAAPYVIAAYAVFLAIVLIYVAIMARRLTRTERDLAELKREVEGSEAVEASAEQEEETERQLGRLSETGSRAMVSNRGTGGPAEEPLL
jgi:flagellar biosynthesis/type III secretory pathway M-ring protein FliF/YscJ